LEFWRSTPRYYFGALGCYGRLWLITFWGGQSFILESHIRFIGPHWSRKFTTLKIWGISKYLQTSRDTFVCPKQSPVFAKIELKKSVLLFRRFFYENGNLKVWVRSFFTHKHYLVYLFCAFSKLHVSHRSCAHHKKCIWPRLPLQDKKLQKISFVWETMGLWAALTISHL
jgi:hypothetical protein